MYNNSSMDWSMLEIAWEFCFSLISFIKELTSSSPFLIFFLLIISWHLLLYNSLCFISFQIYSRFSCVCLWICNWAFLVSCWLCFLQFLLSFFWLLLSALKDNSHLFCAFDLWFTDLLFLLKGTLFYKS